MTRAKTYKRVESPKGRAKCAVHAVSELLTEFAAWKPPPSGGGGNAAPSLRTFVI